MKFFETSKYNSFKKSTYISLRWIGIAGQFIAVNFVFFILNFDFNAQVSNITIFFGILIGNYTEPYLVFTAVTLSLLVSYARAKADAAGIKMQGIGIGERAERLLVIAIIGMIGFMEIAVIIVIIIAGITLAQRIAVLMKNR